MILSNPNERRRFIRFAIVGAIGAVVDFGIMNLFTGLLIFPYIPSSVISFLAAVTSNFFWNRYWTYPDSRSKPLGRQMIQFVIINCIGLLIRTPLLAFLEKNLIHFFTDVLPILSIDPKFLAHNVSLAIAIIVVMLWNFIANRYWTYNDVDN